MSAICPSCGASLPDGGGACAVCGAPAPDAGDTVVEPLPVEETRPTPVHLPLTGLSLAKTYRVQLMNSNLK